MNNLDPDCLRCRSPLEVGDLRCAVCGAAASDETVSPERETVAAVVLRCRSCTAALRYDPRVLAPRCAFCGETAEREEVSDPLEQTREFLPFEVSAEETQRALSRWFGSFGPFRPSDLKSRASVESLVPTWWVGWVFRARADVCWTADSNAGSWQSDWAPHSGKTELYFDEILVSASRGLTERETTALAGSYDLRSARPGPEGVDGEAAIEEFDVQRSQARAHVMAAVDSCAEAEVVEQCIPGSRFRNVHTAALLSGLETRRIAFPAWVLAYRYRGELYRLVVSGQDAECLLGKAPWSVAKIVAAIAAGLALVALIVALIVLFAAGS